jgi:hypothetical protein
MAHDPGDVPDELRNADLQLCLRICPESGNATGIRQVGSSNLLLAADDVANLGGGQPVSGFKLAEDLSQVLRRGGELAHDGRWHPGLDQLRFVVFEGGCYVDQAGNMLPSVAGSGDSPLAERPFRDQFRGYGQLLTKLERLFGRSSAQLSKLGLAPFYDRQFVEIQTEFGMVECLNLLPHRFIHFHPQLPVPKQSQSRR